MDLGTWLEILLVLLYASAAAFALWILLRLLLFVLRKKPRATVHHIFKPEAYVPGLRDSHNDNVRREREKLARERGSA